MRRLAKLRLCLVLLLSLAAAGGGVLAPASARRRQGDGRGAGLRAVSRLPSKDKRWALLVGVSKYEDENITDLRGANDARALKEALVRYAGFPESQVVTLTTDEPRERQPTRENIIRRLALLKGQVPGDGLFLFAFSGHGIENNNQAFLIPSTMSYVDDIDVLKETAVGVEYVKKQIRAMNVQQVLVLLDACRNDPTSGRSDTSNPLTAAFTKGFSFDTRNSEVKAFATLYATSVGDRAYEYAEKGEGYFTWAVVEALKGAAANERGEVTLYGLKKYVEEVVPREVRAGLRRVQQPFAIVEGYTAEELVIAVRAEVVAAPTPNAAPQPYTQRDKDWALVDKQSRVELQLFLTKYRDDFEAALTLKRLEESEPRAGQLMTVKLNDKVQMNFVYIPSGSFKMGSDDGPGDERPAHNVTISRGFWMGETEVTVAQRQAVTKYLDSGDLNGPTTLSWIAVQVMVKAMNEQQNVYTFRLPTEAEWEYAAKAGGAGGKVGDWNSIAWYYNNSGDKQLEGDYDADKATANKDRLHPVKQKSPNNWGLYDMAGNALEWVSSKYTPYPYNPNDGRESQSGEGTGRVVRGGSYLGNPYELTPTYRRDLAAEVAYTSSGFRLVATLRK
jgi:formylglycine-generating enzyme required for sulfatase activity